MRVPVIEAALTAPDSQGTSTNANSLALTVLRYTFPVFHAATNSAPLGGASGRRCPIPRSACLGPDRNVSRRPRRYPRGVGGNRAALGDRPRRHPRNRPPVRDVGARLSARGRDGSRLRLHADPQQSSITGPGLSAAIGFDPARAPPWRRGVPPAGSRSGSRGCQNRRSSAHSRWPPYRRGPDDFLLPGQRRERPVLSLLDRTRSLPRPEGLG